MCNTTICYIASCSEPAIRVSRCNARATKEDDRNAAPCPGWETRVKPRRTRKKYCFYHTGDYLEKKRREAGLLELSAPSRRSHEERAQRSNARYYDEAGYCDPSEYCDQDGLFDQALLDGDFSLAQRHMSRPSSASNDFLPRSTHNSSMTYRHHSPGHTHGVPGGVYASSHHREHPAYDYGRITNAFCASNSSREPSHLRSRHHGGNDKGYRYESRSSRSHGY